MLILKISSDIYYSTEQLSFNDRTYYSAVIIFILEEK